MNFNEYGYTLLNGDCFNVLKKLESNLADCCITSPPYFNLRDYGTAIWGGGNENCEHKNNGNGICSKCEAHKTDLQVGMEETPEKYIERLVSVFHEVKRVLKDDGTLWVNIGDCYCNSNKYSNDKNDYKMKDKIGIPWMLAFALRKDGWYLRQDIIWAKPNPLPESVTDRCTGSHEYIFLLSKNPNYYFDYKAIQEQANYDGRKDIMMHGSPKYGQESIYPEDKKNNTMATKGHARWQFKPGPRIGGNKYGDNDDKRYDTKSGNAYFPQMSENGMDDMILVRNKRDVWTVPTKGYNGAHFATYPKKLIEPCVLAGSRKGGIVLDPFNGAGTTGIMALKHGRKYIGIELNPEYIEITEERYKNDDDCSQKTLF